MSQPQIANMKPEVGHNNNFYFFQVTGSSVEGFVGLSQSVEDSAVTDELHKSPCPQQWHDPGDHGTATPCLLKGQKQGFFGWWIVIHQYEHLLQGRISFCNRD